LSSSRADPAILTHDIAMLRLPSGISIRIPAPETSCVSRIPCLIQYLTRAEAREHCRHAPQRGGDDGRRGMLGRSGRQPTEIVAKRSISGHGVYGIRVAYPPSGMPVLSRGCALSRRRGTRRLQHSIALRSAHCTGARRHAARYREVSGTAGWVAQRNDVFLQYIPSGEGYLRYNLQPPAAAAGCAARGPCRRRLRQQVTERDGC
jgi:hypothetical protein